MMKKYKFGQEVRPSESFSWFKGQDEEVTNETVKKIAEDNYIYFKNWCCPFIGKSDVVRSKGYEIHFRQKSGVVLATVVNNSKSKQYLVNIAE